MARDPELEYWNTGVKPSEQAEESVAVEVPPLETLQNALNNIVGALNDGYMNLTTEFNTRVRERAEGDNNIRYPWYYWTDDLKQFVDERRAALFNDVFDDLRSLVAMLEKRREH